MTTEVKFNQKSAEHAINYIIKEGYAKKLARQSFLDILEEWSRIAEYNRVNLVKLNKGDVGYEECLDLYAKYNGLHLGLKNELSKMATMGRRRSLA